MRGLEARGHTLTKLLRGGSVVQAIAVDRQQKYTNVVTLFCNSWNQSIINKK